MLYCPGMLKACLTCGELSAGSRCPRHTSQAQTRSNNAYRERIGYHVIQRQSYGSQWQRLSRQARRLQPFCSDCFTVDDLSADHSEVAHERQARGLAVRLVDVDVLCRPCNSKRGRSRPVEGQGSWGMAKGYSRLRVRPGVDSESLAEVTTS